MSPKANIHNSSKYNNQLNLSIPNNNSITNQNSLHNNWLNNLFLLEIKIKIIRLKKKMRLRLIMLGRWMLRLIVLRWFTIRKFNQINKESIRRSLDKRIIVSGNLMLRVLTLLKVLIVSVKSYCHNRNLPKLSSKLQ